jgi:hypothetical protein
MAAAPAFGSPPQSSIAAQPSVSHPRSAIAAPKVLPAEPGASVARGLGAGPTELAASSAAAAASGVGPSVRDLGRVTGRPRAGSARIRAPPQ